VVLSPWLIPNYAVEGGRPREAAYLTRFADHPYAGGMPGFLLDMPPITTTAVSSDDGVEPDEETLRSRQVVAAQLAAEAGSDTRLMRAGMRARLQFPARLELDSDWSFYREVDRGMVDVAWLGREHLSFRFAESSAVQFRSGIGPQHLVDSSGWVHGGDVTWGFDAFPGRPVLLAFEASVGVLGKAFTAGLFSRIGVMQGPVEISLGWHQRWIGTVPLGGPFLSINFWI
jgi:hypothetical protein